MLWRARHLGCRRGGILFCRERNGQAAGHRADSGRSAIRRALVQFSLDIDDLRHAPVQLWSAGNVSVFEADMMLTLADHTTLAFPVTHIFHWVDGMIDDARVNVYLESRLAVAMSAFDRTGQAIADFPSHKSIGLRTPSGRNGSSILRPWPADA